jgi:hypothetical protein
MSEVFIFKPDEAEFDVYSDQIKKYAKMNLCQNKIGQSFIDQAVENSSYLFIHLFNGTDMRGFACVKLLEDEFGKKFLYIDLICNAIFHNMPTRSTIDARRIGGKGIIDKVIDLGRSMRISYIKLSAIDDVIPYYYRLGFRFMNVQLEEKAKNLVANLRTAQIQENEEEIEKQLNKIIKTYYPGYLSEQTQEQLGELSGSRIGPMQDFGIPMIYKLNYNGGRKRRTTLRKQKSYKKRKTNKKRKTYRKRNFHNKRKTHRKRK